MRFALFFLGLCATLGLFGAAHAADVMYPLGLHVGIVPLDGLTAAQRFSGFEDAKAGVKVAIAELPSGVFASVDASVKTGQPSADVSRPEAFETAAGKSYLNHESATDGTTKVQRFALLISGANITGYVAVQVPEQAAAAYPEAAIRKMLASATLRTDVPVDELLAILPFKLSNLADFKNVRVIPPGAAVRLSDAAGDLDLGGPPYIIVSLAPTAPGPTDDRARLSRDLAQTLPGLKSVRITNAEPMRIGGLSGYEVRMDATTAKDDKNISVVQWLRFGDGVTLRIVGGATHDDWPKAFPRFRAVRDGIEPKG